MEDTMNEYNIARINALREKAISPPHSFAHMNFKFYCRYNENEDLGSIEMRYADAFAYAMDNTAPAISMGELIVGKPQHPASEEEINIWNSGLHTLGEQVSTHFGQDSHMAIDYSLLLTKGIVGVIDIIDGKMDSCDDSEKLDFYKACRICLEAVCRFSEKYADEAEKMSESCPDERYREELLRIAEICRRVPKYPASGFYEAVQSVNFLTYCVSFCPFRYISVLQYQLGRPDRHFYSYYKDDIKSGNIDDEFAQLLLDCLAIQINNRVPRGLSSGYMIGGRDENGNIVANELTIMLMQVIDDVRLVYPSVGLCMSKDTPREYLAKACEVLSHGRSHPAIFNDDLISEGLVGYGVSPKESHSYIHSTCVEITPAASSHIWVASPYTNMPQLLLDIMDREYDSLDELIKAYFERLDERIKHNLDDQLVYRRERMKRGADPLLSCFVNDCLERGTDIERGGARYDWIMPSFVGVANLVDALYAIKKLVFEDKRITLVKFREICESDYENCEDFRLEILNCIEKYGNDDPDVDGYFSVITKHIASECAEYADEKTGFRLVPSVFCWVMHERFGSVTKATPDGRKAGFPLGDGSGPCQGREHKGPTASIISTTSWCHCDFIGGVAMNMKFSKKTFTADSGKKMEALINTYLMRGGFEIQLNVVDRDTLLEAQKNPENYRDLVVRIGGYSDYFVNLSPAMQAEVLLRTAHEI